MSVLAVPAVVPFWRIVTVAPLIAVTPSDLVTLPEMVPGCGREAFTVVVAETVTEFPGFSVVP